MLKNVVNYNPKGRKVRDFVYEAGLVQGIFVDIGKGDVPYVVTRRPFKRDGVSDMVPIEYVHLGNTAESATDVRRLADILEHPEYDGNTMVSYAPVHCIVDYEKVRAIRLRGVGD